MPPFRFPQLFLAFACALAVPVAGRAAKEEPEDPSKPVSYFRKIRPIFQAQCQGCHQPAKAKGGYVMTDFARLLRGGESADNGELSIVPGDPDKSLLIHDIIPVDGEAEMPKKKPPLAEKEIPVFPIATHDTDYLLVRDNDLTRACLALELAGHAWRELGE